VRAEGVATSSEATIVADEETSFCSDPPVACALNCSVIEFEPGLSPAQRAAGVSTKTSGVLVEVIVRPEAPEIDVPAGVVYVTVMVLLPVGAATAATEILMLPVTPVAPHVRVPVGVGV
jgi:hypothetical protein